jgi:cytochrome bd ubiquinol oxidase subunit II
MSKADVVAVILWAGATLYAVFGGADFGAGMWDLLVGKGKLSDRARAQIDHSIAPVWEANHVWLIFSLVVLWTGFPQAFSAVMTTLYVPLTLALIGVVLRGSGFAFRHAIEGPLQASSTRIFGLSSVITPFFMGTVVGAVASGEVPADGNGDAFSTWTGLLPIIVGCMFVASAAYIAAVFLTHDSRSDEELRAYFVRRAVISAAVAGVFAVAGLVALHADARYVFDRLIDQGLPLIILSGVCGAGALYLLVKGTRPWLLRPLAVGAFVAVIWGWFVAQFPFLIPGQLKIGQAAAAVATQTEIMVVFGAAALTVVPSLILLYVLQQRDVLK